MKTDNGLVSIIVLSFNSNSYITETLDSIYHQSYSPIELIISDDSSSDNTIAICEEWLSMHKARFANAFLLTASKNTGVAANLNRGEAKATGHWVKPLAADDILLPDAIEKYVNHMVTHPEVTYLFGKIHAFGENPSVIFSFYQNTLRYDFFKLTAREQYQKLMANECYIPAASFFYDREKNIGLGIRNNELIPMLEDWPKWFEITKRNVKLYLIDKVTVKYRFHTQSLSNFDNPYKRPFTTSKCKMWLKYQFGYNLRHHPRLALIKYIKVKQYLTQKKIWFALESFGRWTDPLYQKIKGNPHCDWDGNYVY